MTAPIDREALQSLLSRVEAASGPDREIDLAIELAFWRPHGGYDQARPNLISDWPDHYEEVGISGVHSEAIPKLTASVDAVLALIERELKVYSLRLTIDPSGSGADLTWWPDGLYCAREIRGEGVTDGDEPRALLAAFLKAKIEKTTP